MFLTHLVFYSQTIADLNDLLNSIIFLPPYMQVFPPFGTGDQTHDFVLVRQALVLLNSQPLQFLVSHVLNTSSLGIVYQATSIKPVNLQNWIAFI